MPHPEAVGRYRIVSPLGHGAMGVVYRAHDPQLERDVAVKLISVTLSTGHADFQETASRFAREARVAARLQHPNVVAIYDAGEVGDQLFLVMELVEGETLGHRLARGQFPSTEEALDIVAQTAEALSAAHHAGVIHRDMKPGNLLITKRGQVKVADFGIARAMGESTELTRTGMMVGSPAYMAPEQVQGKNIDGRSDLFSLGVVLYEMLLRRKPFPADTLTTLVYQILHEDPFEKIDVSRELRPEIAEFLRWAMAKDPAHRVPDAATFAARARTLAASLSGSATAPTSRMPLAAAPPRAGAPLPPPSYATSAPTAILDRPRRVPLWLPFALGALLLLVIAVVLLLRRPAPPPDTSGGAIAAPPPSAQPLSVEPLPASAKPPELVDEEEAKKKAEEEKRRKEAEEARKRQAAAQVALAPAAAPPAATSTATAPPPAAAPAAEPAPVTAPAPAPAVEVPAISKTFECRRGAEFHVDPEETQVTIDGQAIGTADEWDGAGGGKSWTFPGPGEYTVKLSLSGYRTQWVKIRVTPGAKREIAKVDNELDETN